MTDSNTHWTIQGDGAIGHLLACRFSQSNIPATLVSRSKPSEDHFKVTYQFNDDVQKHSLKVQAVTEITEVDNLILAVKAQQVETAINDIRNALKPSSQIFLLQNGMGTLEKVTELLTDIIDPTNIFPGTNTHGVYLSRNATGLIQVIHAGFGNIVLGSNYLVTKQHVQPTYLEELKQLSLGVSWVEDIERRLWLKLAINAAISPLTAFHHCLNGELMHSDIFREQVESLCNESTILFNEIGVVITKERLIREVFDVIVKTSGNQSSMLQDVITKKTTEIEAITGYLLKKADEYGISMDQHKKVYDSIVNLKR